MEQFKPEMFGLPPYDTWEKCILDIWKVRNILFKFKQAIDYDAIDSDLIISYTRYWMEKCAITHVGRIMLEGRSLKDH